jgi:hypothetical protein
MNHPVSVFNVNWTLPQMLGAETQHGLKHYQQIINPLQRQMWCAGSETPKDQENADIGTKESPTRALFSASKYKFRKAGKEPAADPVQPSAKNDTSNEDASFNNDHTDDNQTISVEPTAQPSQPPSKPATIEIYREYNVQPQQKKGNLQKLLESQTDPTLHLRPISAIEDLPPTKLTLPHIVPYDNSEEVALSRQQRPQPAFPKHAGRSLKAIVQEMNDVLNNLSFLQPMVVELHEGTQNKVIGAGHDGEGGNHQHQRGVRHHVRLARFKPRRKHGRKTRLDKVRDDYNVSTRNMVYNLITDYEMFFQYYHLHKEDYMDPLLPHEITICRPSSKPFETMGNNLSLSNNWWLKVDTKSGLDKKLLSVLPQLRPSSTLPDENYDESVLRKYNKSEREYRITTSYTDTNGTNLIKPWTSQHMDIITTTTTTTPDQSFSSNLKIQHLQPTKTPPLSETELLERIYIDKIWTTEQKRLFLEYENENRAKELRRRWNAHVKEYQGVHSREKLAGMIGAVEKDEDMMRILDEEDRVEENILVAAENAEEEKRDMMVDQVVIRRKPKKKKKQVPMLRKSVLFAEPPLLENGSGGANAKEGYKLDSLQESLEQQKPKPPPQTIKYI